MTAGVTVGLLVLGIASFLIVFGVRIKRYYIRRMNNDWMENGASPWHVRVSWFVLRPFAGGE